MNNDNFISTLSFGRQLCLARQTCNYTIHEFSQMCNMKLRLIERLDIAAKRSILFTRQFHLVAEFLVRCEKITIFKSEFFVAYRQTDNTVYKYTFSNKHEEVVSHY